MLQKLIFIGALTVLARMAGGGLGAWLLDKKGKVDDTTGQPTGGIMPVGLGMLPEICFGILFGVGFFYLIGSIPTLDVLPYYVHVLWAIAVAGWSYGWMETGHGIALGWGRPQTPEQLESLKTRRQQLSPVVDWLADRLGIVKQNTDYSRPVQYCRLFMSVKGFILGLPFGGIPFAIVWPLSYEIGVRVKRHEVSELLTGFFSGIIIISTIAAARAIFN